MVYYNILGIFIIRGWGGLLLGEGSIKGPTPGVGNARGRSACRIGFVKAHDRIVPRMPYVSFRPVPHLCTSASLEVHFPILGLPIPIEICFQLQPKMGLGASFENGQSP